MKIDLVRAFSCHLHSFLSLFRRPTANICGHKTEMSGIILVRGKMYDMSMPQSDNGLPDYCLNCIAEMSIRCAWCGGNITIGDPVILGVPDQGFKVPEYAVYHHEAGQSALVGCIKGECSDSIMLVSGIWMPPGIVLRVPSPLQLCIQGVNGEGPSMVIVDNVQKYPASVSLHRI